MGGFPSDAWDGLSNFVKGTIHFMSDPDLASDMQRDHNRATQFQLKMLATTVASAASLCLGLKFYNNGLIGTIVGVPLIIISLPALWASYNCYQVCSNMVKITESITDYSLLCRSVKNASKSASSRNQAIRLLEKNTLLFKQALELLIE